MLDVFVFETRLSSAAQDFVAEDVLLLNDPYRGLGTGARAATSPWISDLSFLSSILWPAWVSAAAGLPS